MKTMKVVGTAWRKGVQVPILAEVYVEDPAPAVAAEAAPVEAAPVEPVVEDRPSRRQRRHEAVSGDGAE